MQYRPHRYLTDFPVTVRAANGPQRANVVDVNAYGARLKGLKDINEGDKLQIDILSLKAHGVVRWVGPGQLGIVFRPRLSEHEVDTLRHRRDLRKGHHRGTVGFGLREMR